MTSTLPTPPIGIKTNAFLLFVATVFLAWIVINSQSLLDSENSNAGLVSYSTHPTAGTPVGSIPPVPRVTLQWQWNTPDDGMWSLALAGNGSTSLVSHYGSFFAGFPIVRVFAHPGNGAPLATLNVPGSVYQSQNSRVAGARNASVLARISSQVATFGGTSATMTIEKYGGSSPFPTWTYSFPTPLSSGTQYLNTRVSNAGKIVTLQAAGSASTGIIFNPGNTNGVPDRTFTFNSSSTSQGTALSGDGQWYAIMNNGILYLFDLSQPAITSTFLGIYNQFTGTYNTNQTTCLSFSDDGKVFAIGTSAGGSPSKVDVWERNLSNQYSLARSIPFPTLHSCGALAVSAAGDRLAYVTQGPTNPISSNSVTIHAYQRNGNSWTGVPMNTLNDSIPAGSALQDVATSISMTPVGTRFGVGLTGNGSAPEAYLFDSDLRADQPIWSADLPGSVYQMEVSPDGRQLIVANRTAHASQTNGHSELREYSVG